MKNRSRALITMLLVLVVAVTAIFAVLRAGVPTNGLGEEKTITLEDLGEWDTPFMYVPGSQLMVYPVDYATTVEVGQYMYFVVEKDGEFYTPRQVTYEIAVGKDCAAAYVTGSVLGLGTGRIVVKVFLDEDPSVYGYGTVRVINSGTESNLSARRADVSGAPVGDAAFESMISGFPESYKPYLRFLHTTYPSWQFTPVHTGVDFFDAVYNESAFDKNKINNWNASDILKRKYSGDYSFDTGQYGLANTGWVYASANFVSYYMDPRNFMDEQSIMQFESLHYNAEAHTVEGVEGILEGSFMYGTSVSYLDTNGNHVQVDKTHAQVIFEVGVHYDINPYFLAAKIRQEIGSSPSMSVTGTFGGYEGYYNYFNVGAYDGLDEIEKGLRYASGSGSYGRPWNSPEKAIYGGAEFLLENYIGAGQDTGYMQKFNVDADNGYDLYSNQYMTNTSGAVTQAVSAYNGYAKAGLLQTPIEFLIPVFGNMPGTAAQATQIDLGGNAYGIVTKTTTLRTGPAPYYPAVENVVLEAGAGIRILRCVETDALDYRYRTYYPYWYEVTYVQDGQIHTGYVGEEFAVRGASEVLNVGESIKLSPTLYPAGSDDVVRYVSENGAVATVAQDGTITATGRGVVTIVGYTSGGAVDCYRITVK